MTLIADPAQLDLTDCAKEPIHTPGAIQPYGVLLVVDSRSLIVIERAISSGEVTNTYADPLGQPLVDVFDGAIAACVQALAQLEEASVSYLGRFAIGPAGMHHALAHRSGDAIVLELEEPLEGEPGTFEELYPTIRAFMGKVGTAASVDEVCALASEHVRQLTGFDRTLVYRFDPQWNGAVVAEERNQVLPSYMDLRFPESDIPAQARELYRRNTVRLIPNSTYTATPLLRSADARAEAPTDLSLSTLRSVSPVHLQYMRNMGTGASMSVSLLQGDKLWGLVSCHNAEPRRVPYHVRTACEFIGQILSLQISLRESARDVEERMARRATQVRLLGRMAGEEDFIQALEDHHAGLLELTQSSGAAIVHAGQCRLVGECPDKKHVMALVHWLSQRQGSDDFFATDNLPEVWAPAQQLSSIASGILSISISQLHESVLIWFRPEVERTVRWGGDPSHKLGKPEVLSPRKSFESWKEIVRQRSLPWDDVDRDAALELRSAIVDIVLRKAEEMAALNEQLLKSNKELEAFSYSVSHDLRAPFRHIVGYSELLSMSAGERLDDNERRFLDTIVDSAKSAGELVDDLLSFSQMGRSTLSLMTIKMNALVEDVRLKLEMEYREREVEWEIDSLGEVEADPMMLRLVWQNLLSNAVKFTRDSKPARIHVGTYLEGAEKVFFVQDNGCGFDMNYVGKLFGVFQRLHHVEEYEGTGIGLANVGRIVGRHGGRAWAKGKLGEGAVISFSIPLKSGADS
ncbi:Bacteriophytochrome (light-regulated signal transduction histidine kinase) [Pseudoxanthomonas sp. GM95]|uniref:ATP-binding protein n=1 Tax=Pseudoxanthomonas sp. GM95 TaxID=1881043 RepID=UPI0008CBCC0C|nr:ATP-binding protein [Pseudoxanthomonas sp. GM95]SEL94737.1 Bacteriophytochrome (light-regulated signal transduction histidine kinase) [Pseudoxanthomonas sp. GM95]